jgi:GTP-binding protein HflX
MFERPAGGDGALLVSLDFGEEGYSENLEELRLLAHSANLRVLGVIEGKRSRPDPALFAGRGKIEEVQQALSRSDASLVVFSHDLSPAQQRNLEKRLERRVIDRTTLILDIFAQRARSHEGKLQVELAQLEHLAPRLVRGWTHLERQKGGIGLRGPGETQLETDRRLLTRRVKVLKDKLARLRMQRAAQRRSRSRSGVFTVSLVGYTNAGKSTLFNFLAGERAYAADQLFATLDTTTRKVRLYTGKTLVLSDTVGFIRRLPHTLIAAFRATLEETIHADLLLHVVDASAVAADEQALQVNEVLQEIGADRIPQILVLNKIDLITPRTAGVLRDEYDRIARVWLSAKTGEGVDVLRKALEECLDHPAESPVAGSQFALA